MKIYKNILNSVWIVLIFIVPTLIYLKFFESIKPEDTRYLLSALAQSQAALLGIIITVMFIIIPLLSQKYSLRLIWMILKDKKLYLFMFIYSISISYNLIILSFISSIGDQTILALLVMISIWLMITCFIVLYMFMKYVSLNLNMKSLLKRISRHIQRKQLISIKRIASQEKLYEFELRTINKTDEFTPLLDIIKNSINIDTITVRDGILYLSKIYKNLIKQAIFHKYNFVNFINIKKVKDNEKLLLRLVLQDFTLHILDIWQDALLKEDNSTLNVTIDCAREIYFLNEDAADISSLFIEDIFIDIFHEGAILNDSRPLIKNNIDNLITIGNKIMNLNLTHGLISIISSLRKIIETTRKDEVLRESHVKISEFLGEVCVYSAKNKKPAELGDASELLRDTGLIFFDRGYNLAAYTSKLLESSLESSKNIIRTGYTKYLEDFIKNTVEFYAVYSAKQTIDPSFHHCTETVKKILGYAIENESENSIDIMLGSLGRIGDVICERGGVNLDRVYDVLSYVWENHKNSKSQIERMIKSFVKTLCEAYISQYKKKEFRIYFDFISQILNMLFSHKNFGKLSKKSFNDCRKELLLFIYTVEEKELLNKLSKELTKKSK